MFATMVRGNRRRLGLTQEELAASVNLNVRTIRKLESGQIGSPRPATVRLLADAFGLTGADRERFYRTAAGESTDPRPRPGMPAQLPADAAAFTGRRDELARLDAWLTGQDGVPTAMLIVAVCGTAGVGKTALAVHWAHRVAAGFPDGQLYINLRGYDPDQPMSPAEALARLLASFGVAGHDVATDIEELAARYRSTIAGRRALIMLDNAASAEQVRPLLPGSSSCMVVVTSRDSLAGLVAVHGAHRLDLDLLAPGEAFMLMRRLIGQRVDSDTAAAARLAERCARLPLALRVAAELAVSRPGMSLSNLAAELDDQRRRLDLLDAGGDPRAAVKAVFSWSVRRLPPSVAQLFRLLGLHPGPDIDAYAAAALAGTGLEAARSGMELLANAHLVQRTASARYTMHDLLRGYAAAQVGLASTEEQRHAALGRLLGYHLGTAAIAMARLHPAEASGGLRIARPTTPVPDLATPDAARRWLDSERPCLVATSARGAAQGWPRYPVTLSATLFRYLDGGMNIDALAVHGHARDAARQLGDGAGEAHALRRLGHAHLRMGRHERAADHFRRALTLFRRAGDEAGEADTLPSLATVEVRLGQYGPAARRHRKALALYRRLGDPVGQARALSSLGIFKGRTGQYEAAVALFERALALFQQAGHELGQAGTLNNIGLAELRLGRYEAATGHVEAALTALRRLGHTGGEADALSTLGDVQTRLGRPELAAEYQAQALALCREADDLDGQAWAFNGLGEAAHAAGRARDAIAHHERALITAVETGALDQQARAHTGLGHAHRALGDPDRARLHYRQAVARYTDLDLPDAEQLRAYLTEEPGS